MNYWHYCARLEAVGFSRLVSAKDASKAVGSTGSVSALGYVFDEKWAEDNLAAAFIKASTETKKIMGSSDEEWQRLSKSGVIKDGPVEMQVLCDTLKALLLFLRMHLLRVFAAFVVAMAIGSAVGI